MREAEKVRVDNEKMKNNSFFFRKKKLISSKTKKYLAQAFLFSFELFNIRTRIY